jgi:hypothetical protein
LEYFTYLEHLRFDAKPDYKMLREKFYDLFDEMNLSRDQEYDWVI